MAIAKRASPPPRESPRQSDLPPHPYGWLTVHAHSEAAQRAALHPHRIAAAWPAGDQQIVGLRPGASILESDHPAAVPALRRRGYYPFDGIDLPVVSAAPEDAVETGNGQSEQAA